MQMPAIEWPNIFEEMGPGEDPSILLVADARIAGTVYAITAVRMNENLREPDYRDNVGEKAYAATLDDVLDEIEGLTGSIDPELLSLDGGRYLLWMIPTDHE